MQITAEQILRESRELQEQGFKPPTQKITDVTELNEYRLRKRKEFEDLVRRVRWNVSIWVKVCSDMAWPLPALCSCLTYAQAEGRVVACAKSRQSTPQGGGKARWRGFERGVYKQAVNEQGRA